MANEMGNTELVATKNDLILEIVQKELEAKSKVIQSGGISDFSARVGKGMRSILIPRATSFVPQNRASGVLGSNQVITYDTDEITLDKRKHVQWHVDMNDEIESTVAVELENAKRAASGLGRAFDLDAFAAMEAGASHVAQAIAGDVLRDDILAMRMEILLQNGDDSSMVYFASIDQYHNLLKVPEFSENRLYTGNVILSGQIGTLYGQAVIMSNLVPAGQIYLIEKDGLGYAYQRRVSMDERNAPELGSGSKLKVMDAKYGIGILQESVDSGLGFDAVGATESPLIVKLQ